ncbi:hypothetical protein F5883DRAFT_554529 [Diaporthe sp. PMI_573]|nr:hypothetical protein F5883DRAFT_554529 [Diaporthaceae sp. PMI_573]
MAPLIRSCLPVGIAVVYMAQSPCNSCRRSLFLKLQQGAKPNSSTLRGSSRDAELWQRRTFFHSTHTSRTHMYIPPGTEAK